MSQVHKHSYRVLEHCVCLLQLFCSCGCGIKFVLLLWKVHKQPDFRSEINNKISHLKGFHGTKSDESGAQTFTYCTRTLRLPPTTFLLMWLWNKICFTNVVGTQITGFLMKMNHKISHLKGLQRTTPDVSGAQTST